jgi:hypothetical protein
MGQDFQPGAVQPRLDGPNGPPVSRGDLLVRTPLFMKQDKYTLVFGPHPD